MFMLDESQISENSKRFWELIGSFDGERHDNLMEMYGDLEDEPDLAPASPVIHFHNAFPGGYIDHVLRVYDISIKLAQTFKEYGGKLDFTVDELKFSTLHHDLGKLGLPGEPYYIDQPSDWHRKNRGEMYKMNDNAQYMDVTDRTFFMLQKYNVEITRNEFLAIKLADGVFKSGNEKYLEKIPFPYPMTTHLPYIVHWADYMASTIERENSKF